MSEDLISRQATIRFIREKVNLSTFMKRSIDKADKACWELCEMIARELPSAERRGRWIIRDNLGTGWYGITCSECGEDVTSIAPCIGFLPNVKVTLDYCPYCGSKNGGADDV